MQLRSKAPKKQPAQSTSSAVFMSTRSHTAYPKEQLKAALKDEELKADLVKDTKDFKVEPEEYAWVINRLNQRKLERARLEATANEEVLGEFRKIDFTMSDIGIPNKKLPTPVKNLFDWEKFTSQEHAIQSFWQAYYMNDPQNPPQSVEEIMEMDRQLGAYFNTHQEEVAKINDKLTNFWKSQRKGFAPQRKDAALRTLKELKTDKDLYKMYKVFLKRFLCQAQVLRNPTFETVACLYMENYGDTEASNALLSMLRRPLTAALQRCGPNQFPPEDEDLAVQSDPPQINVRGFFQQLGQARYAKTKNGSPLYQGPAGLTEDKFKVCDWYPLKDRNDNTTSYPVYEEDSTFQVEIRRCRLPLLYEGDDDDTDDERVARRKRRGLKDLDDAVTAFVHDREYLAISGQNMNEIFLERLTNTIRPFEDKATAAYGPRVITPVDMTNDFTLGPARLIAKAKKQKEEEKTTTTTASQFNSSNFSSGKRAPVGVKPMATGVLSGSEASKKRAVRSNDGNDVQTSTKRARHN